MTKQIHKYVRNEEQLRKYFKRHVKSLAPKRRTRNWWKAWFKRYYKENRI